MPGVADTPGVEATVDLDNTLAEADVVLFGVPSHAFREVLRKALPYLPAKATIINVAKGIEEESLCRMSMVFAEEAGSDLLEKYVVLSGPSHAEEVGRDIPTAVVAASSRLKSAEYVQDLFMCEFFRFIPTRM